MYFLFWKSNSSFHEIKDELARKPFSDKPGHTWKHRLFWRFLVIHYLGPVVEFERGYNMPHNLIVGLCVTSRRHTRFIGIGFYEYLGNLLFALIPSFAVLDSYKSFTAAVVVFVLIIVGLSFADRKEVKELLLGAKEYYGFKG